MKLRALGAVLVLGGGAVGMAACGGGEDNPTAASTASTAPAVALSIAPTPIVPVLVNDERRYEWTVTITETAGAAATLASIQDGWYDEAGNQLTGGTRRLDARLSANGSVVHGGALTVSNWDWRFAQARFRLTFSDARGRPLEADVAAPVEETMSPSTVPWLIAPASGAVLDNGCDFKSDVVTWDFKWAAVRNAGSYHLFVIGSTAPNPVISRAVDGTSYRWDGGGYITDAHRLGWRWQVRASVGGRWMPFSDERSFDVEPVNTDCR